MTLLEGPDLSLNLSSNALCNGSSITLNNTSTNGSQFEWLPDNGTVLPYSNPVSVSYPIAGSFSAGIAGTNTATGCRDTVYEELNVYTAPDIQVTADPDTGCTPLVAHFINTSTGANSWEWQFSNGEMSTLIEPVVQFSGIGSFSATVIARNILSNQEVCADTRQEFRFTVPGNFASMPDSLWLREASRQFVYLSSFSEKQSALQAWGDVIEQMRVIS